MRVVCAVAMVILNEILNSDKRKHAFKGEYRQSGEPTTTLQLFSEFEIGRRELHSNSGIDTRGHESVIEFEYPTTGSVLITR